MPTSNLNSLIQQGKLLPLDEYDLVIASYSGGKDSLALVLLAQELGIRRMELWHQHVDGEPGSRGLMDWPSTEGYVRATAAALKLPLRFQWKDGGFEGEMLRNNSRTAGVYYENEKGEVVYCPPSDRGKESTRRLFPQTSANLSVRWCSAYLKIDVAKRAINNDPRFKNANILFLTGERREESTARAKYNEVEKHGCSGEKRRVDQWRCVIDWSEQEVWEIIKRYGIVAHPAYYLGFSRVSCMACIFGNSDQWASVRQLSPDNFGRISAYETEFGKTIKNGLTVIQQADKGCAFSGTSDPELVALAMSREYPANKVFIPDGQDWQLPAGAFKRQGGPT